jgi:hypothetical protein
MVRECFKGQNGQDVVIEGKVVEPGRKVKGGQRCIVDIVVNGVEFPGEHVNVFSDNFINPRVFREWIQIPVGTRVRFEGEVEFYVRKGGRGPGDLGVGRIRKVVVE